MLVAASEDGRPATGCEIGMGNCAEAVARLTDDVTFGERNLFNLQTTEVT